MTANVLTVSQVNMYLKQVIDGDRNLKNIFVSGEISNFKSNYSSGHFYFSLKDSNSTIRAVMFSSSAQRVRFRPEDGMKVIVTGRVSVYEVSGQYQLYVDSMQPDGMGALAVAYEQLKNKLAAQGLFDESHKRPLPALPKRIGVITSPTGAVIQDIKNVVSRRCPLTEIVLYPAAVQGDGAPEQLTRGVRYFSTERNVDVIIIGRGGGSFEDLNCFNDENLVWAIYDSKVPIVSAVGHETDFTLCDFAADLRAPTPSAAAELAVPDKAELEKSVENAFSRISALVSERLYTSYQDIDRLRDSVAALHPEKYIESERLSVELLSTRISAATESRLDLERARTEALANQINALSPIRLLQKGYSVTTKNGKCVTSASALKAGDRVSVRFADGTAECTVNNMETMEAEKT